MENNAISSDIRHLNFEHRCNRNAGRTTGSHTAYGQGTKKLRLETLTDFWA
jgi:hypothetical protein